LVAVALAVLLPLIAMDFALSMAAPLALALVLPFAASLAVRPWPELRAALAFCFAPALQRDEKNRAEAGAALEDFRGFSLLSGVLGLIAGLASALPKIGSGRPLERWALLGVWLALYAVLAALGTRILGEFLARIAKASAAGETQAASILKTRYGLSPREWEVAACIASGASYNETADRLFISLSTVKAHLSSVYRKTAVRDKIGLVLLIRRETDKESAD
jgi:DNA-binding CsgD family transcriptional regulator